MGGLFSRNTDGIDKKKNKKKIDVNVELNNTNLEIESYEQSIKQDLFKLKMAQATADESNDWNELKIESLEAVIKVFKTRLEGLYGDKTALRVKRIRIKSDDEADEDIDNALENVVDIRETARRGKELRKAIKKKDESDEEDEEVTLLPKKPKQSSSSSSSVLASSSKTIPILTTEETISLPIATKARNNNNNESKLVEIV